MNWFDFFGALLVVVFLLLGWKYGMRPSLGMLLAIAAGSAAAMWLTPTVAGRIAAGDGGAGLLWSAAVFALVMIAVVALFKLFFGWMFNGTGSGWMSRSGGAVMGGMTGLVATAAAMVFLAQTGTVEAGVEEEGQREQASEILMDSTFSDLFSRVLPHVDHSSLPRELREPMDKLSMNHAP